MFIVDVIARASVPNAGSALRKTSYPGFRLTLSCGRDKKGDGELPLLNKEER
jgi:hypothetical protein